MTVIYITLFLKKISNYWLMIDIEFKATKVENKTT